jgi:peptidyl-prolyl cis-trans isomerase A (cyclophilin A)
MKKLFALLLLIGVPAAFAQEKKTAPTPQPSTQQKAEQKTEQKAPAPKLPPGVYAHFQTSMGTFTCELFEKQAPIAVGNFIGLAQGTKEYTDPRTNQKVKGKPFYDGTVFHRIIDGFMIQGGDPLATGTGTPGYSFQNEISPDLKFDREGRLGMANAGVPNTNGSQFFVTLAPKDFLNGGYTVWGQVVDGMDVVKAIGKVPTKVGPGGEKSSPIMPVRLIRVTIERVK